MVAAVLSGNRNFEGRIHPLARASYLASPPLVVAFALAGRVDIDLTTEPLGTDVDGRPVFLADIWPEPEEIRDGHRQRRSTRALPRDVRDRVRGRRPLAGAADPGGRPLRLGRRTRRTSRKPPFFEGLRPDAGAGRATSTGCACWPCWATRSRPTTSPPPGSIAAVVAGRPVAPGARRRTARLQLVRRAARPPRGDDARHVRQHPAAQRAGRREARVRTRSTCRTASRASSTTPRCATRPRASRWPSSPVANTAPAHRATGRPRARRSSGSGCRPGRELRADPSLEPGRDGHPAARSSGPARAPRRSA